jgi:hypothetical protein
MELRSDVNHAILGAVPRIPVDSLLCCSGGGIPACMFTLGAIQRQVETGEFYQHDVVSSASGSTVVCALVERCYALGYVTPSSPEWYTVHVVRPIHRLVGDGTLSGSWLERIARSITIGAVWRWPTDILLRAFASALFGDEQHPSGAGAADLAVPVFLYNYADLQSGRILHDMTDLQSGDDDLVRKIARCCIPITTINGVAAADAGFKGNQYGTNALYTYSPRRLTLVAIKNGYQYAAYPVRSWWQLLLQRVLHDDSVDVSSVLIADPDVGSHRTRLCTISSGLFPSSDPHHRGLFYDYFGHTTPSFCDSARWKYCTAVGACKVLHNEGYIQMGETLNSHGRVPNADVHNDGARLVRRAGYADSRTF